MKKSSTNTGVSKKDKGNTQPIKSKEQVQQSKDQRIDQDFPGFPHPPATEEVVKTKKDLPTKVQEG